MKDVPGSFDNPESDWNPSFSFPIGYTSLQMNEESGFNTALLDTNPVTGLPYWTEEINIPLRYIVPFDLQEIGRFSEEIVSLMFRVNTYNGFPNTATGQVYFINMNGQTIDSLFLNGPLDIEKGIVMENGEESTQTHNQTDVLFSQDKIDALSNVRFVLIEGAINNVSLDTNLVNFYSNYKLDIQLGVQAELNMSLSSN